MNSLIVPWSFTISLRGDSGILFCPSPLFPMFSFFPFRFAWGDVWIWALFPQNSYLLVGQPAGSLCKERLRHRCSAETSKSLLPTLPAFPGCDWMAKMSGDVLDIMQDQIRVLRSPVQDRLPALSWTLQVTTNFFMSNGERKEIGDSCKWGWAFECRCWYRAGKGHAHSLQMRAARWKGSCRYSVRKEGR